MEEDENDEHHSEDYKIMAVLYYLKHKESLRETCDKLGCKFQSLYRWVKQYEETGELKRKLRENKNLKLTPEIIDYVKELSIKNPTYTLQEYAEFVRDKFKIEITYRSMYNVLHFLKITRKRVRVKYYPEAKQETETTDLAEHYKKLQTYDYTKTICLDETAIKLNMTLSYGRSKSGTRVIKKTNKYPFKKYNLLAAICYDKVVGCVLYPETNQGIKGKDVLEFYNTYIKDKKEYKDYLIVMDNAVIHKSKDLQEAIKAGGHTLMYSFPYHPETNSIEEWFSQLKHYVKKESPQKFEEIKPVLNKILKDKIKKEHLRHYLYHMFFPPEFPEKKK